MVYSVQYSMERIKVDETAFKPAVGHLKGY